METPRRTMKRRVEREVARQLLLIRNQTPTTTQTPRLDSGDLSGIKRTRLDSKFQDCQIVDLNEVDADSVNSIAVSGDIVDFYVIIITEM